VSVKIFPGDLF